MKKGLNLQPLSGEKGMALLLVISVISLLTVVVLEFNTEMRDGLTWSRNYTDRERLSVTVESGFNLAVASLHLDNYANDYDCLYDNWAKSTEITSKDLGFGGRAKIKISDLSSRFQMNSLVNISDENGDDRIGTKDARDILFRLLDSGMLAIDDAFQAREIVDSIIDWLDSDDTVSRYGAEGVYYASLVPSYRIRNGPMVWPNELLAIKGITPLILYGNDEKKGLAEYITVYGTDGKININTADIEVVRALSPKVDREDAELIVGFRSDEENIQLLKHHSWYKQVPGLSRGVEIKNNLIRTSSTIFSIEVEADLNGMFMKMTAIVKRTGREQVEILYRKVD